MVAGFIAILGSLDTKGLEISYLCARVIAEGGQPLVIDTGVLGEPSFQAEISRHEVAQAGGGSIAALIAGGDKTTALLTMAAGAGQILLDLLKQGKLAGVLSIGGSRGTSLSTRAMQMLPLGLPKLMVSTIASGQTTFGPYVGTKDITLMHSVADVQGINMITRAIFNNAASAIVGMSHAAPTSQSHSGPVFTASMLGVTTTLIGKIREKMEVEGAEIIAFHSVGTGGLAMEELILTGVVAGVFEVTPGEILQEYVGAPCSAGPDRMKAAGRLGVPQVFAPGGLDFIIEGPLESITAKWSGRKVMQHTPSITLVRASPEEMSVTARIIADRLSASNGPVAAIIPLQGFGWFSQPGQPLHYPEADQAFIQTFKNRVGSRVEICELDTHLNSSLVCDTAVAMMRKMVRL